METSYGSFAELLSAGMRAKGLDYRTLASLAGVSHTYLWQLAGGGSRERRDATRRPKRPSREVAVRLAEILDLSIKDALQAAGYPPGGPDLSGQPAIVRYSTLRPDVPAIFQRGLDEARRGHPDRAVILLREAVNLGGVSFIRAHTGLGVAYMGTRDYTAAIQEFTRVIDLFRQDAASLPNNAASAAIDGVELADVLYNRGLAYQDSGRHREGIVDFQAAIDAGGPHTDLYYAARCFSDLALGRFHRVVRAALDFAADPTSAGRFTTAALDVRLYQAYALARLGQFEAGLALADAIGLLCPSYWYTSFVQGAIASLYCASLDAKAARGDGRMSAPRQAKLEALLDSGYRYCARALELNPAGRESLLAESEEDFAYFSRRPEFAEFFADAPDVQRPA